MNGGLAALPALALVAGLHLAGQATFVHAQDAPQDLATAFERCQQIEHGQPAEAIALAEELLARDEVRMAPVLRARALGCLGWAQAQSGDVTAARATTEALQQALTGISSLTDRIPLLRRVAGLMQRTDRIRESIEVLSEALVLAEAPELADERISLQINLAIAHSEARNHEIAIGHYQRALAAIDARPDDPRRMPVLYNLGLTLRGAGRIDEARDTFLELIEPLQAPGLEIRLASLYSVLGSTERELGDLDRAEDYLARSAALHEDLDNPAERTALLIERSGIALERGRADTAVTYAREALAEAERADFTGSMRGALQALAEALAEQAAFEDAYDAQRRYIEISDRYWRDQLDAQLEDAEARFGNERQARELAELRQVQQEQDFALRRQQLRQSVLYGAAATALLIAIGVFFSQRRHTRRLRRLSRTDPLTGLANRRQATRWLDALFERSGEDWTLIWLLDLDHFKRINDNAGHDVGDLALTELARLLERFSTSHGTRTARWGGEEFLLIGRASDPDAARRLAETLRRAVARMDVRDHAGRAIRLTASIGYSPLFGLHRHSGQSRWEPAMQVADQLLYRAKQAGRNRSYGIWPADGRRAIQVHDFGTAIRNGDCRLLEGPAPAD
jgi:diguanylate cyclase (GGDEF)-like protein